MSCLNELKAKGYVQEVGDVWVTATDEPPVETDFSIETNKNEGWNLQEPSEMGEISDELLDALEAEQNP